MARTLPLPAAAETRCFGLMQCARATNCDYCTHPGEDCQHYPALQMDCEERGEVVQCRKYKSALRAGEADD